MGSDRIVALVAGCWALGCGAVGCGGSDAGTGAGAAGDVWENPYPDYQSALYRDPAAWLCGPDAERDWCFEDLSATEVLPDGSFATVKHEAASAPELDCFYVYPTVNLLGEARNVGLLENPDYALDPLLSQAARFNRVCRVFAPRYRQATLTAFSHPDADSFLNVAFEDVLDAFKHYVSIHNQGRKLVLLGHSQGSRMLSLLLSQLFDGEDEQAARLRAQLVVALLIGGDVWVPRDSPVGGTFERLPLCESPEQTACVVGLRSYARGSPPPGAGFAVGETPPEGGDPACTDPSLLAGGDGVLAESYFPNFAYQASFDPGVDRPPEIDQPFTLYRNFYQGRCARNEAGFSYYEIGYPADPADRRENLIPLDGALFSPALLGLHVLDYNFPQAELLELTEIKAGDRMRSR